MRSFSCTCASWPVGQRRRSAPAAARSRWRRPSSVEHGPERRRAAASTMAARSATVFTTVGLRRATAARCSSALRSGRRARRPRPGIGGARERVGVALPGVRIALLQASRAPGSCRRVARTTRSAARSVGACARCSAASALTDRQALRRHQQPVQAADGEAVVGRDARAHCAACASVIDRWVVGQRERRDLQPVVARAGGERALLREGQRRSTSLHSASCVRSIGGAPPGPEQRRRTRPAPWR